MIDISYPLIFIFFAARYKPGNRGYSSVWLERLHGMQEVVGSSPTISTFRIVLFIQEQADISVSGLTSN